jgi:polysaccharide export outer membrane protein
VWVDDVPASEFGGKPEAYVINVGDLLNVRVYNQDAMSTRARVRPDGKIAVPLLGDIEARGRKPAELAKALEARLKEFVVAPAVIVTVEEAQPMLVSVIGEVARPGILTLEPTSGVLQALAGAGGVTDYANRDRIFVFRRSPQLRIRFTYESLTRGEGKGAAFLLQQGDVVVVE